MADDFKYNRFEGMSPMRKAMLILAEGAMSFGEGLSKTPYYSNYMEQDRDRAKMAYERWKTEKAAQEQQPIVNSEGKVVGYRPKGSVWEQKTGINLSTALNIISDPIKAMQLKREDPELYKELKSMVSSAKKEGTLKKSIPSQNSETIMDTDWGNTNF